MLIHTDPYETTFGTAINTVTIVRDFLASVSLNESILKVTLGMGSYNDFTPIYLTGMYNEEREIAVFDHPLTITYKDKDYLVSDVRHLIKNQRKLVIESYTEIDKKYVTDREMLDFYKQRAGLTLIAMEQNSLKELYRLSDIPMHIYGGMFGYLLSNKLNINPVQRMDIEMLSKYYYYGICKGQLNKLDMSLFIKKINETTHMGIQHIQDVLSLLENADGLESLVGAFNKVINVHGANGLDVGVLGQLVGTMWYGYKAPAMMMVAIDHPPTWISLCLRVMNNKRFKHINLFKIADRYSKDSKGDKFIKNVTTYLDKNL